MRFLKRYRWPILGVLAGILIIGFLAFRPDKLFVDDVVDESLEDAFGAAAGAEPTPTTEATTTTTTTTPSTTASESDQPTSTTTTTTTTTTPTTTTTTEPPGPVAVTSGSFFGIDHRAEGTATIYEQDGRFVLRFEDDTDIQNGPDLWVWVLPSDDYVEARPTPSSTSGRSRGTSAARTTSSPHRTTRTCTASC